MPDCFKCYRTNNQLEQFDVHPITYNSFYVSFLLSSQNTMICSIAGYI